MKKLLFVVTVVLCIIFCNTNIGEAAKKDTWTFEGKVYQIEDITDFLNSYNIDWNTYAMCAVNITEKSVFVHDIKNHQTVYYIIYRNDTVVERYVTAWEGF